MSYLFTIPHSLPQRTRIRWAGEPGERAAIVELAARIDTLPGVSRSEARLTTGSIIIEHDEAVWDSLRQRLSEELALEFTPADEALGKTGLETFNDGIGRLDASFKRADLDLRSMSFLFLLLMALTQALRGQVGVSSFSFLWYAMTMASRTRNPVNAPTAYPDADRIKPI